MRTTSIKLEAKQPGDLEVTRLESRGGDFHSFFTTSFNVLQTVYVYSWMSRGPPFMKLMQWIRSAPSQQITISSFRTYHNLGGTRPFLSTSKYVLTIWFKSYFSSKKKSRQNVLCLFDFKLMFESCTFGSHLGDKHKFVSTEADSRLKQSVWLTDCGESILLPFHPASESSIISNLHS